MFNDLSFRAMQSSLDAMWMKQNIIVHNLANYETPGFKAKQLSFQDTLEDAQKGLGDRTKYAFQATVTTDEAAVVRPDGNNVDLDKENIELMNTYYQTLALYQKISGQISDMRYVIGQAFK